MNTTSPTSRPDDERIGVVGLGFISDFHLEAIRRCAPEATIVGCDVTRSLGERALSGGTIDEFVTDAADLVEMGVAAAFVLVPPQLHVTVAGPLLDAGIDVMMEKPMATSTSECDALIERARRANALLATGHNQLFYDRWDAATRAIEDGEIGSVRSIDMVSRRPLPFLRAGDARPWMMHAPRNILFEVAPHAFAQVLDIAPNAVVSNALVSAPMDVDGRLFYANWTIAALDDDVPITISLSFEDAQSQTFISVRGTLGAVTVDFDLNTIEFSRRTPAPFDAEKLTTATRGARQRATGAVATFGRVVMQKAGLGSAIDPFTGSIVNSTKSFLDARRSRELDRRHSPEMGRSVVKFGESVALASGVDDHVEARRTRPLVHPAPASDHAPDAESPERRRVLVVGATGFIGRAVVERLSDEHDVTVAVRNVRASQALFDPLPVVVEPGDLRDSDRLAELLEEDQVVVHLAYSGATEWNELLMADVEPTIEFARRAAEAGVARFVYASSIALYDAGNADETINECTEASDGVLRSSPYARSKAETERRLRELDDELPIVITRPGVVVGAGSDPCHWGVAAWPYPNVCKHWGSGDHPLPLVLVDDVAEAYSALMRNDDGIDGRSFNLCGPGLVTARRYVEEMERCSGRPIRQIESRPGVTFVSALATWGLKRLGDSSLGMPSYRDIAGRTFAAKFDCSHASETLGWKPVDEIDELLARGVCEPVREFARRLDDW